MIRMLFRLYFSAPNGVRVAIACFVMLVGAMVLIVGLRTPPNHEYAAVNGQVVEIEQPVNWKERAMPGAVIGAIGIGLFCLTGKSPAEKAGYNF